MSLSGRLCICILLAGACSKRAAPDPPLLEAWVNLVRAMNEVAAREDLSQLPPLESGKQVAAALAPARRQLSSLAPAWRALDEPARRKLLVRVQQRARPELATLYPRVARLTDRYRREPSEKWNEALRAALGEFKSTDMMWAFELFSHDTVKELSEMMEHGER